MRTHFSIALLVVAAVASAARGGDDPKGIPLWPNGAPGSEGQTAPEVVRIGDDGVRRVSSIHNPSIAPHLPAKESATGAAVIILPGGSHRYLSIDNEGHFAAKWLAERGVAAFVLKYRLSRDTDSPYKKEVHSFQDAQRALRLVRSRAKEWNVDPQRVGFMSFSAGGDIATRAACQFDAGNPKAADPVERESSRPDFQVLIYAGAVGDDVELPKDPPPAFICLAYDDRPKLGIALNLFQRIREAGGNAEMHIYAKGGHGFGMRNRPLPITGWPVRLHEWMAERGLLTATAEKEKVAGPADKP